MQSAKTLRVYLAAENLAVVVYELTGALPSEERFGLTTQMRRAAVSIGSNIAEGCGRGGSAELARFLRIALGSATELEFQLGLAKRLFMLNAAQAVNAMQECTEVQRMLVRLVQRVRPVVEASRGGPKTVNRKP